MKIDLVRRGIRASYHSNQESTSVPYQLSWCDAHLWAYAEHYGLAELISEDFQHDRLYGSVRIVNPFL